jgi:putative ABC transport system permease protein
MRTISRWARRRPVTAAAVIVTMALGIGASTAVYAVVEAVVLRALPVRDPGRLVWMWNARVERERAPFSALDFADYREQNRVLEGLAPFINWTANLTGAGDAERLESVRVDPTFFDLLGVTPATGRVFGSGDARAQVAVLTDGLWRRRFGADPAIVGRLVSLNGSGYTVVGVLPAGFVFPFRDAEIAVPLSIESDPRVPDRGAGFLRVVARLKPGVSLTAAKTNLDAIAARLRRDYPDANAKKIGVNLFPLDREIVGDARSLLLTLLGAVALLLLVACANIANLLLVALASRRRELSMRIALGATRARIVGQILGEIAVLVRRRRRRRVVRRSSARARARMVGRHGIAAAGRHRADAGRLRVCHDGDGCRRAAVRSGARVASVRRTRGRPRRRRPIEYLERPSGPRAS